MDEIIPFLKEAISVVTQFNQMMRKYEWVVQVLDTSSSKSAPAFTPMSTHWSSPVEALDAFLVKYPYVQGRPLMSTQLASAIRMVTRPHHRSHVEHLGLTNPRRLGMLLLKLEQEGSPLVEVRGVPGHDHKKRWMLQRRDSAQTHRANSKKTAVQPSTSLTVQEGAAFLNVATDTLYRWAASGKIPSFKVGWFRRFNKDDLQRWLESKRAVPAANPTLSLALVDAATLARALGVHPSTVRRLARDRKIPSYVVGDSLRFNPTEVQQALHSDRRISGGHKA